MTACPPARVQKISPDYKFPKVHSLCLSIGDITLAQARHVIAMLKATGRNGIRRKQLLIKYNGF